ncbi:MAG: hypothetical protein OQK12_00845 [Motiliproteus sp.]|nr:hypothetical protein [Motiliproteus sp.]MCW9052001.1 hypothetical protein [Motiliproteus sp.]
MNYPLIIAFEMSSYEDDAFPIAVAWSLSSGQIKSTLISPDSEWLDEIYEQGILMSTDPETLLHEGHSPKSVFEELLLDLEDNPLYCIDPYQTEQALEKICDSLDREMETAIRPVAELLVSVPTEERELCRNECETMLELDLSLPADQVRLWLELFNRLQS